MKRVFIAVGLSTLIFPGLGQIYNKQKFKGVVIIAAIVVVTFMLSYSVSKLVRNNFDTSQKIDFRQVNEFITLQKENNPEPFVFYYLIIIILMAYSSIDAGVTAYLAQKKIDSHQQIDETQKGG